MMDFDPNVCEFEIKYTKDQLPIPVVHGIHLHSIYQPRKEAETFIAQNQGTLAEKNVILFLGLGLGYHLNAAIPVLEKLYGPQGFLLGVIEPNHLTLENYYRFSPSDNQNLRIFCAAQPEELYLRSDFVNFLALGPKIIPHPASFNLYQDYFKKFMAFKASEALADIAQVVSDPGLQAYLQKSSAPDLKQFMQELDHQTLQDLDYFTLAFQALTASSSEEKSWANR
ncbi:MAG: hypothetical protein J6Y94_01700 [Bacteriovoracaceae bacterium]|nr:hypothetical protein [Bacteriovoracaceae bacterium]